LRHKAKNKKMKFDHPLFNDLLCYWKSCCGKDQIPTVNEFDLIELPAALPDVTYWELQSDGGIVCRMTGTKVVDRMSVDITGMYLGDILPPKDVPIIQKAFQTMQDSRCGLWLRSHNRHPNGRIVRMEALSLPLSADGSALPKCITLNHQLETLGYDHSEDESSLVLGQKFERRELIDLGWGKPEMSE
jgi:hypothetical protein